MISVRGAEHDEILGRPWFVFGLLVLCTGLAILLRGYAYGVEDQNLYLPFILHWNNPAIFPHDYLLKLGYARESIVWSLLAYAALWVRLPTLMAALWIASSFLVLLLTYKIGLALWGSPRAAWVAVFLWLPTYRVPGVANNTFDGYFTTRILGTLLGLLALYFFFQRKHVRSAAAAFFGILFHVISLLPLAAALGLAHLLRRRWKALALMFSACVAATGILMAFSAHFGIRHDIFTMYSGQWLTIVRHADFELFPQSWPRNAWINLGLYIASFYLILWGRKRTGELTAKEEDTAIINTGIVVCSGIGLAGTLTGIAILVQLCLFRGYLFFMFLLALCLAGPVARLLRENRWPPVAAGCWTALAWSTGDWMLQAAAVLMLIAYPVLIRADELWAWLTRKKERLLSASVAVLLIFAAWEVSRLVFGWSLAAWQPDHKALVGSLLATWILLLLRALAPRLWKRAGATLLPLSLGVLVLLSPTAFMVDHLGGYTWFRRAYGSAIWTSERRLKEEAEAVERRSALAHLVKDNVPEYSTVIVPPDWMSFRLDTLRSPFVTFKDRAPAEFSKGYADQWKARLDSIHGIDYTRGAWRWDNSLPLTPSEISTLAMRYRSIHLDYILTRAEYDFPVTGRWQDWSLYRIPSTVSQTSRR
jgi:hypothetical protein